MLSRIWPIIYIKSQFLLVAPNLKPAIHGLYDPSRYNTNEPSGTGYSPTQVLKFPLPETGYLCVTYFVPKLAEHFPKFPISLIAKCVSTDRDVRDAQCLH